MKKFFNLFQTLFLFFTCLTVYAEDLPYLNSLKTVEIQGKEIQTNLSQNNNVFYPECVNSYRLAVYVVGDEAEFYEVLIGFFKELASYGLIKIPNNLQDVSKFNDRLFLDEIEGLNKESCISFANNWLYRSDYDFKSRKKSKEEIYKKIYDGDISMILGIGTAAGIDFIDSSLQVPIIIADAENPDIVGIMEPSEFSTKSNVFVQWFKDHIEHSLKVYRSILSYSSLGIIYDPNMQMQKIHNVSKIEELSSKFDFTVKTCVSSVINTNTEELEKNLENCIDYFVEQGVDAVYFPLYSDLEKVDFSSIIDPLIKNGIFVISNDKILVKKGALLSVYKSNMIDLGFFIGRTVARIVNGEKIENISQIYRSNFKIALNLNTARFVKWAPNLEILLLVEELIDR